MCVVCGDDLHLSGILVIFTAKSLAAVLLVLTATMNKKSNKMKTNHGFATFYTITKLQLLVPPWGNQHLLF